MFKIMNASFGPVARAPSALGSIVKSSSFLRTSYTYTTTTTTTTTTTVTVPFTVLTLILKLVYL